MATELLALRFKIIIIEGGEVGVRRPTMCRERPNGIAVDGAPIMAALHQNVALPRWRRDMMLRELDSSTQRPWLSKRCPKSCAHIDIVRAKMKRTFVS